MYESYNVSVERVFNGLKYDEIPNILKDFDRYLINPKVKVIRDVNMFGVQIDSYSISVTYTIDTLSREDIVECAERCLELLEKEIEESKESTSNREEVIDPNEIIIEHMGFSKLVRDRLLQKGIYTLEDLTNVTAKELLKIRHFGPARLQEVVDKMAKYGAALKEPEEESTNQ